MNTEKKKLTGCRDLFTSSWNLYKDRFWDLISIGLISTLVLFLFQGLFILLGNVKHIPSAGVSAVALGIVNFAAILVVILVTIWASAAMLVAVSKSDESLSAVEAYRRAWVFVGKYFWVSILAALIVISGTILLVIPGIYLAIGLSMAPLIVINEFDEVTIVSALKKSREYVNGYWWAVLGRFMFLLLVLLGIGILLGIFLFLPLTFLAAMGPQFNAIFRGIGNAIVDILLTPFSTAFWFMIYAGLKQIKQSQVS